MLYRKKLIAAAAVLLAFSIIAGCAAAGPAASSQNGSTPGSLPSSSVVTPSSSATTPSSAVKGPEADNLTPVFDPLGLLLQVPKAVRQKMRQDYLTQFINPDLPYTADDVKLTIVTILDDVYALFVDCHSGYMEVICYETIDGVTFVFPNSQRMYIYADGHYYSLQEAFDTQIISKEDLLKIRKDHEPLGAYEPSEEFEAHIIDVSIEEAERGTIRVIHSKEEFDLLLASDQDLASGFTELLDRYDDAFFAENTLILVGVWNSTGGHDYVVTGVYPQMDGSYLINIETQSPEYVELLPESCILCIEVNTVLEEDVVLNVHMDRL